MFLVDTLPWYEEINRLIFVRTIQTIIVCFLSMFICQAIKIATFSIKEKKFTWKALFTTGGMPSSHTATVISLVVTMGLFQVHDNGTLDYSFAVALVFASIIIHDAMGVRLEASKHAKILNNLLKDEDKETRVALGFGKKGYLKELLGHKSFEVFMGAVAGILAGLIGYFIFVNVV